MTNSSWSLDDLTINTDGDIRASHTLSREQILALGWLIFYQEDRSYPKMARECSLSIRQCQIAVEELMELNIVRFR